MASVLIHAGFHKTATTTLQDSARVNAALLEQHVRIFLKEDMIDVTEGARRYSVTPSRANLTLFEDAAQALFGGLDKNDPRPVALLSEDLAGVMPGRSDVKDYAAATALLPRLTQACHEAFDAPDICVYFTTRAKEDWYASAHWQLIRYSRKGLTLDSFRKDFNGAANFEQLCGDIQAGMEHGTVTSMTLEEVRQFKHGPIEPVLEALAVPPEVTTQLQDPAPANPSYPDLRALFRELNMSPLNDAQVEELKASILRMRRKQRQDTA